MSTNGMKRVSLSPRSRTKLVHVEAPGCVVNIRQGLHDSDGREVTSVEILCDQYAGEPAVTLPDLLNIGDAAKIILRNYPIMSEEELIHYLTTNKPERHSANIRVVRDNPA